MGSWSTPICIFKMSSALQRGGSGACSKAAEAAPPGVQVVENFSGSQEARSECVPYIKGPEESEAPSGCLPQTLFYQGGGGNDGRKSCDSLLQRHSHRDYVERDSFKGTLNLGFANKSQDLHLTS